MLKVLFLCTENACRSQMAEGLVNHDLAGQVKAFSAGIRPSRVNPRAIQVMGELGIDISQRHSKSVDDLAGRRETITPRYVSQAGLKIMEILKLLPLTNCKACGYATCMAYAAALREGEIRLEDCPPLWEEKFREKQVKLQAYLESFGWRALDAE